MWGRGVGGSLSVLRRCSQAVIREGFYSHLALLFGDVSKDLKIKANIGRNGCEHSKFLFPAFLEPNSVNLRIEIVVDVARQASRIEAHMKIRPLGHEVADKV